MIRFFIKKLIPGILILSIITPFAFGALPRKADAQVLNFDAGNFAQNLIQAGAAVGTAANQYSIWLKEYVLDGLGLLIAKQIIRGITTSLVQWINSGFEGSPSFMQNPGAFFLDVADQITGDFLAKYGGPLTDLCSPFSIDIRLALAFKYRPNVPKRYECTLSKIIGNTKDAVQGASINGFTAGDFKQGGMPAFITMTTEPQNNVYGAYLTAESELSVRVAGARLEKKSELGAGRGFLSWRDPKCKDEVKTNNAKITKDLDELSNGVEGESYAQTNSRVGGDLSNAQLKSVNDCPIQTPGSVIESQLQNNLGGPLRELELADVINEVVNALFAQLVTQVLQKGLGAVTGSGPGDSTSYISDIQAEAAAANNTGRVEETRTSMLSGMSSYITNTEQYKSNKEKALEALIATKNNYANVQACYAAKIAATNPELRSGDKAEAQDRINNIEGVITTKVVPLAAKAQVSVEEARTRLQTLLDLRAAVTTAKTVNDLNAPSQEYSLLASQQKLTSAKDISDSLQEPSSTLEQTAPMNEQANQMKQDCELFPQVRRR